MISWRTRAGRAAGGVRLAGRIGLGGTECNMTDTCACTDSLHMMEWND